MQVITVLSPTAAGPSYFAHKVLKSIMVSAFVPDSNGAVNPTLTSSPSVNAAQQSVLSTMVIPLTYKLYIISNNY